MPGTKIVLNAGEPDPDPAPFLFVSAEIKKRISEKAYDPKRSAYEAERQRPAPRPGAAPLVPFLAAPRVGRAAVWASVPFGTYQVAGASQMG